MEKEIYVLKWYIFDCSSYKLDDVECYVFEDLNNCKEYLKRLAYQIYIDNEGDGVKIEDWKIMLYDNYDYEIERQFIIG